MEEGEEDSPPLFIFFPYGEDALCALQFNCRWEVCSDEVAESLQLPLRVRDPAVLACSEMPGDGRSPGLLLLQGLGCGSSGVGAALLHGWEELWSSTAPGCLRAPALRVRGVPGAGMLLPCWAQLPSAALER